MVTLVIGATLATASDDTQLRPADLRYRGAFAVPGDAFAYGGHALAFYPQGDPDGAEDGFSGSLFVAGLAPDRLVGEIGIPAPLVGAGSGEAAFNSLPSATVLRAPADPTGGWSDNCTHDPECQYRDIGGLAWLPEQQRLAWNLLDWYNAARIDQDSLGWCRVDFSQAVGVWHIGPRDDSEFFHNAKTADYLFTAPSAVAERALNGRSLLAGAHREAGSLGGSQGPALVATAPWQDGDPPAAGTELGAQTLLYYREFYDCVWIAENQIQPEPAAGVCDFPGYRAADRWQGGAWIEAGERAAVLLFGRKGQGVNCYDTGANCSNDPCMASKGYHAYPYQPQILFYDVDALLLSTSGHQEPWIVLPYSVQAVTDITLGRSDCAVLGATALDRDNQRLYVAEQQAGPNGETVIHVWDIAARPARDPAWRVTEIYQATMGYAPDAEGLDYWVAQLNRGDWTPTTVAQSFFDQPLVAALYPSALSDEAFVDALYQNIFGREADDAGMTYWLEALGTGAVSPDQMIVALIEGGWGNLAAAPDMAVFSNKVEVGLAFAEAQRARGLVYTALTPTTQNALREAGTSVLANVTADPATRDAAIAAIPGRLDALP